MDILPNQFCLTQFSDYVNLLGWRLPRRDHHQPIPHFYVILYIVKCCLKVGPEMFKTTSLLAPAL